MFLNKLPHNDLEVPIYFLRKLYVEFIKGLKANYWSMKMNTSIGAGAPQDKPGVK